jgi:hypothetical protein
MRCKFGWCTIEGRAEFSLLPPLFAFKSSQQILYHYLSTQRLASPDLHLPSSDIYIFFLVEMEVMKEVIEE